MLPLSLNQKVLGVLSLGPKQSEEPYSSSDLRMLGSVADADRPGAREQPADGGGHGADCRARARQRELEIAREVQERLFPQEYPPVPGLEYPAPAGRRCGGRRLLRLRDAVARRLGIAIGDVSGKGIPAALLMATLRAFLRGQAMGGEKDLAGMMHNLNALVYESLGDQPLRDVLLRPVQRRHTGARLRERRPQCADVVPAVRATGPEVIRLDTGGPVIGLLPLCSYQQGSITLQPGDVLIAFTDGISEAMNLQDEEFGEEGLSRR